MDSTNYYYQQLTYAQILVKEPCRGCALFFAFSLSFSHRHLLPQRHTHGCHMGAMLKPRDRLAAPTAPVSQAGSPGIWLPDLFERSFTRITFSIRVM
jgi:hypothetical protein